MPRRARLSATGVLLLLLPALQAAADPIAAAGRIEYKSTGGSCSAALVQPDIIVTAAHCAGGDPEDSAFRPGDGRARVSYPVERFVSHPLYDDFNTRPEWRFRFDIAVGKLKYPVPAARAVPLPQGEDAEIGETLFIVSWRSGEGDRPRQRACPVIEGLPGLVTLGCSAAGGESGAPVIRKTDQGLEIVAVISSRGQQLRQPIAQASDVRLRIPPLMDALKRP